MSHEKGRDGGWVNYTMGLRSQWSREYFTDSFALILFVLFNSFDL